MTFWALAQLIIPILAPIVALFLYLLQREFNRTDIMIKALGNHFKHDEEYQYKILEALTILIDRTKNL